jgi:hypothetical protein
MVREWGNGINVHVVHNFICIVNNKLYMERFSALIQSVNNSIMSLWQETFYSL